MPEYDDKGWPVQPKPTEIERRAYIRGLEAAHILASTRVGIKHFHADRWRAVHQVMADIEAEGRRMLADPERGFFRVRCGWCDEGKATVHNIGGDDVTDRCTDETPCCDRRGEYNGFGSDGPLAFVCPNHCPCHD